MSKKDGGGFLSIDGPFMRTMELVLNLFLLNVLVVICSIPIITVGAAFTAMNHQLYRMSKNEDGYVVRGFFKDFKENFKTSTLTWLILLPIGAFLGFDLYVFSEGMSFPSAYKCVVIALAAIYVMGLVYVFPVLARFETTPFLAIKNAYAMALYGFLKSILMVALVVAPWIVAMYVANFVLANLLFGISLPCYINVFLYRKTFAVFEKKQAQARGELEETSEEQSSEAATEGADISDFATERNDDVEMQEDE